MPYLCSLCYNNNNNTNICKAHNVSMQAESEGQNICRQMNDMIGDYNGIFCAL